MSLDTIEEDLGDGEEFHDEADEVLDDDAEEGELGGVCKTCLGTREVSVMGRVWPNEPHEAAVDTKPCPDCTTNINQDDD